MCQIEPIIDTVTDRNVDELLGDVDLIFDGLDNFRSDTSDKYSGAVDPYLFTTPGRSGSSAVFNPPRDRVPGMHHAPHRGQVRRQLRDSRESALQS